MNLNTLNPSGVDAVIVDLDGTMVDTMVKGVKKTKPKWARKIGILWAEWG